MYGSNEKFTNMYYEDGIWVKYMIINSNEYRNLFNDIINTENNLSLFQ